MRSAVGKARGERGRKGKEAEGGGGGGGGGRRGKEGKEAYKNLTYLSQVNNLKAPHGKCNDSVELDFYASYTMSTCYMDCKQRYVISRCLCRDVYMATDPFQGDSFSDYKTMPKTIRLF